MEVIRIDERPLEPYAPPEIVDYGDLVDVTAHDHQHRRLRRRSRLPGDRARARGGDGAEGDRE